MGLKVGYEYRTNHLSKIEGGVTVIVRKDTGQILEYTDVKRPQAYIKKILNGTDKDHILRIKIRYNDGSEETIK